MTNQDWALLDECILFAYRKRLEIDLMVGADTPTLVSNVNKENTMARVIGTQRMANGIKLLFEGSKPLEGGGEHVVTSNTKVTWDGEEVKDVADKLTSFLGTGGRVEFGSGKNGEAEFKTVR